MLPRVVKGSLTSLGKSSQLGLHRHRLLDGLRRMPRPRPVEPNSKLKVPSSALDLGLAAVRQKGVLAFVQVTQACSICLLPGDVAQSLSIAFRNLKGSAASGLCNAPMASRMIIGTRSDEQSFDAQGLHLLTPCFHAT